MHFLLLCLCFTYLFYYIIVSITMFLCEALWVCLLYEKCYINKVALPLVKWSAKPPEGTPYLVLPPHPSCRPSPRLQHSSPPASDKPSKDSAIKAPATRSGPRPTQSPVGNIRPRTWLARRLHARSSDGIGRGWHQCPALSQLYTRQTHRNRQTLTLLASRES